MDPPYSFPQDYALALLTHAAMQTHSSETSNSHSSYERPATSLARAEVRGPSTRPITNQSNDDLQSPSQGTNGAQARSPDILNSYTAVVPSTRGMETLSFDPGQVGQHAYMRPGYHSIGSQISTNFANNLGILNAESYDDGRLSISTQEARLRNQHYQVLPFGMTDTPELRLDLEMRTNSDDYERGVTRRKKHKIDSQNADEEEEARKKARGRPRVDTKDETAADVSFTIL